MDGGPGIAGFEDARLVGRGGFGEVYRASQPSFGREVAIKVLPEALDEEGRRRFDRERSAMGSLSGHPNVVTVHDSGLTRDGRPYLVMEYLPGGSLAGKAGPGRPLPWDDVARLGVKMAGALESAHGLGILHCDVKPENILMSAYGEPKLADFGVARLASATGNGPVFASLTHAAPEVLAGHPASPAADVYALGSTLAALATGRPASEADAPQAPSAVVARVMSEPATVRIPGAPEALARALERAIAKDPAARQASAQALGRELQQVLEDAGGGSTPLPLGTLVSADRPAESGEDTRGAPWRPQPAATEAPEAGGSRRSVAVLAAVVTAVVLAAGVAVVVFGTGNGPRGEDPQQTAAVETPATSAPVVTPGPVAAAPTTVAAPKLAVATDRTPCNDTLTYGQVTQCSIDTPGQTRRHTFQGAEGDRVLVDAAQIKGNVLPGIAVLRPDGTDACARLSECVLGTAGRHTVLVADTFGPIAGNNTGEYSIYLQRLNDPVGCRPLTYGSATEGVVSRPGAVDCLTFNGSTGDRLFITSATTTGDVVPAFAVLRPDGSNACSRLKECVLDTNGRHTVIASDTTGVTTGSRTGTFRVSVTCTAGPCK